MTDAPKSAAAELALHYAANGFPVFPCDASTKGPLTGHGFKDASTDPAAVAAFWAEHPQALIGIPTGKASGVFVLDLDTDDETGEALGEAWLASVGLTDLLEGPGAATPSGRRHVFFRADGLAEGLRCTAGKPVPKVDTRGDGGYVIAPGSVRPDGAYLAIRGGMEARPLPALPEALLRALKAKTQAAASARLEIDTGLNFWDNEAPADLAEAAEIIAQIPPDCGYDDWLAALMGLHGSVAQIG